MLRSANAAINAREVSGNGGTGLPSGVTSVIFADEPDPWLHDRLVWHPHAFRRRMTEHDVQLGKAEDERVVPVDEGRLDAIA